MIKRIIPILMLTLFVSACSIGSKEEKLNVIFFLVDDMGWTDLSCMGSDLYQTPNIDNLALKGLKFTDAYSSCTVCSPTRASVLTGKYPASINCTDWISGHQRPWEKLAVPDWQQYVDTAEYTMAEAFRDNGYSTIHLGKWHLGHDSIYWPENQGFDENHGGWEKGAPNRAGDYSGYFSPYGNPRLEDGSNGEYLTERLAEEACNFIERNGNKPFFMNFWFYNVHTPLQAKEDKIAKYKSRLNDSLTHNNPVYASMIEHVDDAVGKVLETLREKGLEDNTIIVFTSDNGGLCNNFNRKWGSATSNKPLRTGKGDMYEGGVRVPLIVYHPNGTRIGETESTPIISTDYFPTLAKIAPLQIPDDKTSWDGVDFSALIDSSVMLKRKAIYWHYPHFHLEGAEPYSAIRKGDWKLIQHLDNDSIELYNLAEDLGETNNLAFVKPDKAQQLLSDLIQWKGKVGAQPPVENENYNPQLAPYFHFQKKEEFEKLQIHN